MRAGETEKFVAVASADNGQPVATDYTWRVEPADLGTIVGQGVEALFTGKTPGTGKIVAVASNGVIGETQITVVVGPISDLRVRR